MSHAELTVDLGARSYPIHVERGLLDGGDWLADLFAKQQVLLVTNQTIAPLYLDKLGAKIEAEAARYASIVLPDGEQYKTLETASTIYDQLMQSRFDRQCVLVALGGGVVGDMTGFVAATYQRGVRFVQIPTTLLAQVDSSVGGKTGVNHPRGKNMIGAFHQPEAVLIDTATLDTLPAREYSAGLAEVIKYGLIADRPFLDWLAENMDALLARQPEVLAEAIRRSCENKAKVVARDELESGLRAILNLGHTFGHALETITDYRYWLHGEAVGYGMLMALDLSARMGLISAEDSSYAAGIIRAAGLPESPPPGLDSERVLELMGSDKKVQHGRLRLVLLRALGDAYVTAEVDSQVLQQTLEHCL